MMVESELSRFRTCCLNEIRRGGKGRGFVGNTFRGNDIYKTNKTNKQSFKTLVEVCETSTKYQRYKTLHLLLSCPYLTMNLDPNPKTKRDLYSLSNLWGVEEGQVFDLGGLGLGMMNRGPTNRKEKRG